MGARCSSPHHQGAGRRSSRCADMRARRTVRLSIMLTLPPAIAVLSIGYQLPALARAAGWSAATLCYGPTRTSRRLLSAASGAKRRAAPVLSPALLPTGAAEAARCDTNSRFALFGEKI